VAEFPRRPDPDRLAEKVRAETRAEMWAWASKFWQEEARVLLAERDRERARVRDLLGAAEDYLLWEPRRAGHAEAHRELAAKVRAAGKPAPEETARTHETRRGAMSEPINLDHLASRARTQLYTSARVHSVPVRPLDLAALVEAVKAAQKLVDDADDHGRPMFDRVLQLRAALAPFKAGASS
jgi:hypothetical protein